MGRRYVALTHELEARRNRSHDRILTTELQRPGQGESIAHAYGIVSLASPT